MSRRCCRCQQSMLQFCEVNVHWQYVQGQCLCSGFLILADLSSSCQSCTWVLLMVIDTMLPTAISGLPHSRHVSVTTVPAHATVFPSAAQLGLGVKQHQQCTLAAHRMLAPRLKHQSPHHNPSSRSVACSQVSIVWVSCTLTGSLPPPHQTRGQDQVEQSIDRPALLLALKIS